MPSLIPGYEYDIFISYRHNDNRSNWVTEFVRDLREELAATIKEPVSVYFDQNPHDGLLETHNVDKSLEAKLKCLIFIPILSQTYCDPKSFAWQHEFCAFNKLAKEDQFGRDIKLINGNVAGRILPIKIHDLDAEDKMLLQSELEEVLRSIDFIFKAPGVNRPLLPTDNADKNLNKTLYRDQINKTANAVKNITNALRTPARIMGTTAALKTEQTNGDAYHKTIIVLPFVNISSDPDQEYFSDGLTEEVITGLSFLQDLLVISRGSAMTFKGSKKRIQEIASDVNVRFVLEGSVRKSGNRLRINARLIDAQTDAHVWAERYSGSMEEIFDIQENLSRKIVNALRIKLSPEEEGKITARPIENLHAYECYQRARREVLHGTAEGLNRALQLIETALHIVGENELLYSALAYVRLESINLVIAPGESCLKEIEECMEKIFVLNRDSSQGLFFKGAINYKRGNVQEAVRDLKQSFAKDPNNSNTLFYLSGLLGFSGKPSAGLPYATRLQEIDPLTPLSQMWWAWVGFLHSGRFDDLLYPVRMAYQMDPEAPFLVWGYATVLVLNKRLEEAYDIIDRLAVRSPENTFAKVCILLRHSFQGNKEKALQSITPAFIAAVRWDEHLSWQMADCYALLDQKEEALDWLEHASLNRGFINYPLLAERDPCLVSIRGEDRFTRIMEKVKYKWENFEV